MITQTTDRALTDGESGGARKLLINGRNLSFLASGIGSPVVVFETGLGAESDEWAPVQRVLAEYSGTIRYDRAGRGASDPARPGRDAYSIVDDLHELLHSGCMRGPFLLVGHSLGGLLTRVFAHRYPEQVAGIVLVDSMHEDQFDVLGPAFPKPGPSDTPELIGLRKFWTGGWKKPAATTERMNLAEVLRQGRQIESLGDLPIHVITAGAFLNGLQLRPRERESLQLRWEELQAKLLSLSSRTKQTFVRECGHFVQRERPDVVVQAILDLERSA